MTEPMKKVYHLEGDHEMTVYTDESGYIHCKIYRYWTPYDMESRQLSAIIFSSTYKNKDDMIQELRDKLDLYRFMFNTAISAVEREGL
jgi:hypothetical protein